MTHPPLPLSIFLTILGMVASVIIFVFSNFETQKHAEQQYQTQSKNIDNVHSEIESLHQDVRDQREELNRKLDILLSHR